MRVEPVSPQEDLIPPVSGSSSSAVVVPHLVTRAPGLAAALISPSSSLPYNSGVRVCKCERSLLAVSPSLPLPQAGLDEDKQTELVRCCGASVRASARSRAWETAGEPVSVRSATRTPGWIRQFVSPPSARCRSAGPRCEAWLTTRAAAKRPPGQSSLQRAGQPPSSALIPAAAARSRRLISTASAPTQLAPGRLARGLPRGRVEMTCPPLAKQPTTPQQQTPTSPRAMMTTARRAAGGGSHAAGAGLAPRAAARRWLSSGRRWGARVARRAAPAAAAPRRSAACCTLLFSRVTLRAAPRCAPASRFSVAVPAHPGGSSPRCSFQHPDAAEPSPPRVRPARRRTRRRPRPPPPADPARTGRASPLPSGCALPNTP